MDESYFDRIFGGKALVSFKDVHNAGGPSSQTIYRAYRAGLIDIVKNGNRTTLTRATAERILTEGLGEIDFLYGKLGEERDQLSPPPKRRPQLRKKVAAARAS